MSPYIERSIGGAGTGKTRQVLENLTQAKKELGLSIDQIGFCTFTRAGRAEISERAAGEWGVSVDALTKKGWFRTAHSIAHRQMDVKQDQLITDDEWLCEAMGVKICTEIDSRGERRYLAGDGGDSTVEHSLAAWDLARSRLCSVVSILERQRACGGQIPSDAAVVRTIEHYEHRKRLGGKLDFTDMISRFAGVKFTVNGAEECPPEGDVPDLRVLAIDEAQDSSPLVDRVCRRLASAPRMERVWLCGDPYQSIHSFAGGDYRLFLSWEAHESVMPRSYRCPSRILSLGERCLQGMRSGYRDRQIQPAAEGGEIEKCLWAGESLRGLSASSSVLILGRCAFALKDYAQELNSKYLPYSWVDRAKEGSRTLAGYIALWRLEHKRPINAGDWAAAIEILAVSQEGVAFLRRGEKTAWKRGERSNVDIILPNERFMTEAGMEQPLIDLIMKGEWTEAVEAKSRERAILWHRTATKHGVDVACSPPIRLSTIHSAKGLEADTVILSLQSSRATENSRLSLPDLYDEECRIAYVAVTRARQRLVVVNDAKSYRMEIPV